nr:MAG TPA: hypothetical protein [Caudoviricetes sp.]
MNVEIHFFTYLCFNIRLETGIWLKISCRRREDVCSFFYCI